MIIGTGFHTYEIYQGPASGRWQVIRIAPDHETFVGAFKTFAEARGVVDGLRLAGGVS